MTWTSSRFTSRGSNLTSSKNNKQKKYKTTVQYLLHEHDTLKKKGGVKERDRERERRVALIPLIFKTHFLEKRSTKTEMSQKNIDTEG